MADCAPPRSCRTGKLSQDHRASFQDIGESGPFCLLFAGCTDTPSPSGASGRPWCYTEAQLSQGGVQSWEYCAPVVDYDALRQESTRESPAKVSEVREYVGKLGKAQRAAEVALDMYQKQCASRPS